MSASVLFPSITVLDPALSLFFIQLVIIWAVCRSLAMVGQYFHQPSVVFEIVGGIILGPSALGKYEPYANSIIPKSSLEFLVLFANFGLQIYLFLVGLELDLGILKAHSHTTVLVAIFGLIVPFGFGLALSVLMYGEYAPDVNGKKTAFTTFSVFIGTAMAVTALPVLARILKEKALMFTKPGFIALGAAVITDAVAWVLLVVAISLANASSTAIGGWIFLGIMSYAVVVFTLGRYILHVVVHLVETYSTTVHTINNLLTLTLILLFLSASLVAQLGIDPIVGSFIFGVAVPRHTRLYKICIETLENFVLILLLPLFFAVSGLRTDVTVLRPYPDLLILLLVCITASLGKLLGAGLAAYCCGTALRDSAAVAVLMNTRGLVELIILNIGKDFNVLSDRAFSILVLMCLFTTFITCPLLSVVYPLHKRQLVYGKDGAGEVYIDTQAPNGAQSDGDKDKGSAKNGTTARGAVDADLELADLERSNSLSNSLSHSNSGSGRHITSTIAAQSMQVQQEIIPLPPLHVPVPNTLVPDQRVQVGTPTGTTDGTLDMTAAVAGGEYKEGIV